MKSPSFIGIASDTPASPLAPGRSAGRSGFPFAGSQSAPVEPPGLGSPHFTARVPGSQSPRCRHEVCPRLVRRPEAVALDQPLLVVPALELPKILDKFGDRGEVPDPKQVLPQGANKPFGDTVALRLTDEARR